MRMNTEIMKRLDMMEKGDVNSVIDSFLKRERERKIWQELYAISLMKRIYILYQENAN